MNSIIVLKILSMLFSILMLVPNTVPLILVRQTTGETIVAVDDEEMHIRYQNGEWNGRKLVTFGHTAEVVDGMLIVDEKSSAWPADSSVMNNSDPIITDSKGTWFEDHERVEIRHDFRGTNLATFKLEVNEDAGWWCTEVRQDKIYVYNGDGTEVAVITMSE